MGLFLTVCIEYGLSDLSALKDSIKNLEAAAMIRNLLPIGPMAILSREEDYARATPEPMRDMSGMK